MVTEGALRLKLRSNFAEDAEICIRGHDIAIMDEVAEPPATEHTGKYQFRKIFGHRHDGGYRVSRRPAYENAHLEWLTSLYGGLVVP